MFELRKIGIVRRASAWLLDAILLSVLAVGFMWIISLLCGFSQAQALAMQYRNDWETFCKEEIPGIAAVYGYDYNEADNSVKTKDGAEAPLADVMGKMVEGVAEFYGFTFTQTGNNYTISKGDVPATLNDVKEALLTQEGERPVFADAFIRYTGLPSVDKQTEYVHNLLFMMISIGLALGYIILEFIVPLFLKNGQTVGKKVFSICLVRPNCVKVTALAVFGRTVIGKYAVEAMFPILLAFMFFFGGLGLLALILFVAILLLNAILFFATKNRTPIHDILAHTVAVDMRLQMIFASDDELNEKKALAKKEFIQQEKNI